MPEPIALPSPSECKDESSQPEVNVSFLESLVGYNARRAAVTAMSAFNRRMAPFDLRPVDFSLLSMIAHNAGITSRQLCRTLDVLPPNLVGIVTALEKRGLLERKPHPGDRRATGLHLTDTGNMLMQKAEPAATQMDAEVAHRLSTTEMRSLIRLLKKIYA